MAIVDATRELEQRDASPIGWEGKRLDEMLGLYRGQLGRAVP